MRNEKTFDIVSTKDGSTIPVTVRQVSPVALQKHQHLFAGVLQEVFQSAQRGSGLDLKDKMAVTVASMSALVSLFATAKPEVLEKANAVFLSNATAEVTLSHGTVKEKVDNKFFDAHCSIGSMHRILREAVQLNYADFFQELGISAPIEMPLPPSSPAPEVP